MGRRVTYKDLYTLIAEEIKKRIQFDTTSKYSDHLKRDSIKPLGMSGPYISDITTADVITAVYDILQDTLPARIISGLNVTATDPISNKINISSGKGTVGGKVYELTNDVTIEVPFDDTTEVFYVNLYLDRVLIDKNQSSSKLTIAKIIVPKPGVTSLVQDDKDESWNAYIVNYHEYKLYGDAYGKFEENTVELLRDNISPILADNLIGNIRLSEDLKIINTAGSLEMDSEEIRLKDANGTIIAKFNKKGTYFYNSNGIEIAKFAADEARVGNILITKNSIESSNYTAGESGFKINDAGFAEFENVLIRGSLRSSAFEYDTVSAVGGKLIVSKATVLEQDMSSSDSATLTVKDAVFSLNEVIIIKDGLQEEYLLITDTTNAPTYSVLRDLKGDFSSNDNPAWSKGVAVVSLGVGGSGSQSGFIVLDSVSSDSPFIDINYRNSTTYNDYTTKVRLGNLAGITDSDFGGSLSGFGLYATNVYLKGQLFAPTIKTALSGARIELDTQKLVAYDDSGNEVFKILLTDFSGVGTAGDVIIGDVSANNYVKWDQSTGQLIVRGTLNASDITTGKLSADRITSGTINAANIILGSGGVFKSSDYSEGEKGFKLDATDGLRIYSGAVDAEITLIEGASLRQQFEITTQNYTDDTKTEFNNGTLTNVEVIGDSETSPIVRLSGSNTSGTFLSQVFTINSAELGTIQWEQFIPNNSFDYAYNYGSAHSYTSGSSGEENNGTEDNCIDGNDSTYTHWGDGTHYWGEHPIVEIDLGQAYTINKVRMYAGSSGTISSQGHKLQYSTDGVTWTDVFSYVYTADYTTTFSPIRARYWRWYGGVCQEYKDSWALYSLELYATASNPEIRVYTRTASSSDMSDAEEWKPSTSGTTGYTNSAGSAIESTTNTYIQYKVEFYRDNGTDVSPEIHWVKINFDTITIKSLLIPSNSITTEKLADASVSESKIIDGSISQAKLKTATGELSVHVNAINGTEDNLVVLPGGQYGFYPRMRFKQTNTGTAQFNIYHSCECEGWKSVSGYLDSYDTSYKTYAHLYVKVEITSSGSGTPNAYSYAQQRYITSSGPDHWIFLLVAKKDIYDNKGNLIHKKGQIVASYQAPDHPCYGQGGDENDISHPFGNYNPDLHEIVLVDNDILQQLKPLVNRKNTLLTLINEKCIIDDWSRPKYKPREIIEIDEYGDRSGIVIARFKTPDWAKIKITKDEIELKKRVVDKLPDFIKYKKLRLKTEKEIKIERNRRLK